jgi:hypothetical protein
MEAFFAKPNPIIEISGKWQLKLNNNFARNQMVFLITLI